MFVCFFKKKYISNCELKGLLALPMEPSKKQSSRSRKKYKLMEKKNNRKIWRELRRKVTYPKSHNRKMMQVGFKPRSAC